ncbi:hypothetical protein FNU76_11780 [Chitinimonas arctica]|uniref:Transferrin-binding protein-like solute binding protein n=1 Tax=Chitinimonas arctica TaxID=2594795 RepID=A0A516SFP4_9NEIS|nr:hypothetical protein FNU76_11780 [Chitinimonas arctica]
MHVGGITLDSADNVKAIDGAGGYTFRSNTAFVEDTGSIVLPDGGGGIKVNWGRWESAPPSHVFQVTSGGQAKPDVNAFYFMYSDRLTPADKLSSAVHSGVRATYQLVGGPAPTSQSNGEMGTLHNLSVLVNFGSQQIEQYQLAVHFAHQSYNASNTAPVPITPTFSVGLAGTCTGCTQSGTVPVGGTAHGAFVGNLAEGIMTSFGFGTSGGNRAVYGNGVLKR